jgi:hypothetical protein
MSSGAAAGFGMDSTVMKVVGLCAFFVRFASPTQFRQGVIAMWAVFATALWRRFVDVYVCVYGRGACARTALGAVIVWELLFMRF